MNIEIAALCEYVSLKNGNLTIFNTFENWEDASSLSCMFVVKVRFEATETGPKQIKARFSDSDGSEIWSDGGLVDIQPEDTRSQVGFLIGQMNLLAPQIQAGDYQFEVLDQTGEQKISIPLYIHG
jgi:hypothetical protein